MPYTKTTWVSGTTPASATNMNNLETQYTEAISSLNQDLFSAFVLSGLVATTDGSVANKLDVTAGVAYLLQSDSTLRRRAQVAVNFTTAIASTTYYLDLNPDGTWSWGTAHSAQANYLSICQVTTDASGNISAVTDKRTLASPWLGGGPPQGINVGQHGAAGSQVTQEVFRFGGALTSYGNDTYIGTYADSAGVGGIFLYLVFAADKGFIFTQQGIGGGNIFGVGITPTSGVKSWIDQGGVLHATAPVTLAAGNQEVGVVGMQQYGQAGHNVSLMANFKTVLTNTPTSITLSDVAAPTNASSFNTNLYRVTGFNLFWTAGTTGDTGATKSYTTVGNCLLAVDPAAHTFDHHCDNCGAVHRAVPFTELRMQLGETPAHSALAYDCPNCGASEHFNCGLTADDEHDPAPQGSGEYRTTRGAQTVMIRQLMLALGLPVAA